MADSWIRRIGLYRDVWIAAIAWSRTSLETQAVVMCTTSQCKLRSLCANSGMWNVILIVTLPPFGFWVWVFAIKAYCWYQLLNLSYHVSVCACACVCYACVYSCLRSCVRARMSIAHIYITLSASIEWHKWPTIKKQHSDITVQKWNKQNIGWFDTNWPRTRYDTNRHLRNDCLGPRLACDVVHTGCLHLHHHHHLRLYPYLRRGQFLPPPRLLQHRFRSTYIGAYDISSECGTCNSINKTCMP